MTYATMEHAIEAAKLPAASISVSSYLQLSLFERLSSAWPSTFRRMISKSECLHKNKMVVLNIQVIENGIRSLCRCEDGVFSLMRAFHMGNTRWVYLNIALCVNLLVRPHVSLHVTREGRGVIDKRNSRRYALAAHGCCNPGGACPRLLLAEY